jgi:hypothetical protein
VSDVEASRASPEVLEVVRAIERAGELLAAAALVLEEEADVAELLQRRQNELMALAEHLRQRGAAT